MISSICAGCGLAQIRLLCCDKFETYRNWNGTNKHEHLKVWFWSLLLVAVLTPAFAYPSVAIQEQMVVHTHY